MNKVFLILVLFLAICKTSSAYEFSYDAVTVLDYDAEESVYFCSGLQTGAFQYKNMEQGRNLPTASLLEHTTHKLIEYTGARNSKISKLVIEGYQHYVDCLNADNAVTYNNCMDIAHQCQDVSEDFYGQFVKK